MELNPGSSQTPAWANIPQWQIDELKKLQASNKLYGVIPQILAGIDLAESGGSGGAINSSGYGGYYGLGVGDTYFSGQPGGPVTSNLLHGTDVSSFDVQTVIAAGEFARLLQSNSNDPYKAEKAYQGGSTEGEQVFASLGISPQDIPTSIPTGSGSSGGAGKGGSGGSSGKKPETTFGKVLGTLDSWLNPDAPSALNNIETLGLSNLQNMAIQIFARGAFALLSAGVILGGVLILSNKSGLGVGGAQVFRIAQAQQRIRNVRSAQELSSQRLANTQQASIGRASREEAALKLRAEQHNLRVEQHVARVQGGYKP